MGNEQYTEDQKQTYPKRDPGRRNQAGHLTEIWFKRGMNPLSNVGSGQIGKAKKVRDRITTDPESRATLSRTLPLAVDCTATSS